MSNNAENTPAQPQQQHKEDTSPEEYICYYDFEIPIWLIIVLSIITVALSATAIGIAYKWSDDRGFKDVFGIKYHYDDHANPPVLWKPIHANQLVQLLGYKNAELFAKLDRDGNGLISMVEYEALVHHIKQDWRHPLTQQVLGTPSKCKNDCVQLRYEVEPPMLHKILLFRNNSRRLIPAPACNSSTDTAVCEIMQKLSDYSQSGQVNTMVATSAEMIAAALLPQSRQQPVKVGMVYNLIGMPSQEYFLHKQRRITAGIYFEPGELSLARLLQPLAPNVFLIPRYGVHSSAAIIRAISESYFDILFRFHIEFQIANETSMRSVYVTPGGIEGRLILSRKQPILPILFQANLASVTIGNASTFNCKVELPHQSMLNGQAVMQHLKISLPSAKPIENIDWNHQMPEAVAWRRLRSRMLPHTIANFHDNLQSALNSIAEQPDDRQLHVIVAIGGPDQSAHDVARAISQMVFTAKDIQLRLKYYYVNVWLNLADIDKVDNNTFRNLALNGLSSTLADKADALLRKCEGPVTSLLLDSKLNQLSALWPNEIMEAMNPPDGLPDPFSQPTQQSSPISQQEQGLAEEERQIEEATEAIKTQLISTYMKFMRFDVNQRNIS